MKFIFSLLILLFIHNVHAATCKQTLLAILADAKQKVNSALASGTPCHNAGMVGRSNGAPGCFPPDLITLGNALTPLHTSAKSACDGICHTEGKKQACKDITNKNKLREIGIKGAMSFIEASNDFK